MRTRGQSAIHFQSLPIELQIPQRVDGCGTLIAVESKLSNWASMGKL